MTLYQTVDCLWTTGDRSVCVQGGSGGVMRTQRTINQHSPGGVAERKKRTESLYQLRKE